MKAKYCPAQSRICSCDESKYQLCQAESIYFNKTVKGITPVTSTGGSSSYYELPKDAKELDDLILHKELPWHIANIFKACYRWGQKDGNSKLYEARKIKWFIERQIQHLEKTGESNE